MSGRLLVKVGDLSYSWYLWHWPILVMAPALLPDGGFELKAAAVVVSYVAAAFSYRFVEEPIRHRVALHVNAAHVVLLALAATIAAAAVLTLLKNRAAGEQLRSLRQQLIVAARNDLPAVYSKGCHASITAEHVAECAAGALHSRRVMLLVGDSHAAHWFPALDQIAARNGWKLVSITKSACPAIDVTVTLETHRRDYRECASWHADAMRRIVDLKPDLVLLASSSRYASVSADQWQAATLRTLVTLEALGVRSVLIRDTPWPGKDIPACLARAEHRGLLHSKACTYDRALALAPGLAIFEAEGKAVAKSGHARIVDMTPYICPAEMCPAMSGDTVHFSDGNHLTASFSKYLAQELEAELQLAPER